MRKYTLLLFLSLLIIFLIPKETYALSGNAGTGEYYFNSSGKLTSSSGVVNDNLWDEILKAKEKSVMEEVKNSFNNSFSTTSVKGDLVLSDGDNLWNMTSYTKYNNSRSAKTMVLSSGTTEYKIYIPRGVESVPSGTINTGGGTTLTSYTDRSVNSAELKAFYKAVDQYKDAVKAGVNAGLLAAGHNIYSMYPEKQVPLTDILEDAKVNGLTMDYKTIKSSGASMKYSLDYFFHPTFGRIEPKDLKSIKWEDKVKDIKLTPSSSGVLTYELNDEYKAFITKSNNEMETITYVENKNITSSDGLTSWTTPISKTKVEPVSAVDTAFRVAFPKNFSGVVASGNTTFKVTADSGFEILQGIKLRVTHNRVYISSGEGYTDVGSFLDFNINTDGMSIYNLTIDNSGKISKTGKKVAVVIPLWYQEAVLDTSKSGGDVFITGRTVKFGNNYTDKTSLNSNNKDLFGIDSRIGGLVADSIRNFAFHKGADYTGSAAHIALDHGVSSFSVAPSFYNSSEDIKGFVLFRNNYFIEDKSLISWLESSEAKAIAGVKAEDLMNLVTGKLTEVTGRTLTYAEWKRIQDIKWELNDQRGVKWMAIIRTVTIVFGFMLIVYSILLLFAYWVDIFNIVIDFSIVKTMTFGRFQPVTSDVDMQYLQETKGDVKYVNFFKMLVVMVSGIILGILFIFCTPIIEFVLWLYTKITTTVGGV